ncbi:hypothetical protein C8A00DRAFT_41682 [Chaetomidium leptoderma]|uniref:Uncharacterized protein n=1 Tax=Chaetomidium leptoderma TaxID=669021 RepID=A0AAN6VR59_9PEZI|nr:hypothetical protein C8A00DRAFT_41682 [Chaetomidium leptoderma]
MPLKKHNKETTRQAVRHQQPLSLLPHTANSQLLLLSCRALYRETAALLYSANRFVISYLYQGSLGLEPLCTLSPTSLASLTSLKVVLNESSCHLPIDSSSYPPGASPDRKYCAKYHGSLHRLPLLDPALGLHLIFAKLVARAVLNEWYDTAAYLSPYVGRLTLSLEVTWSRQYPGYQVYRPPHIHHGCLLSQCRFGDYVTNPGPGLPLGPGCFCRRRHAGFSFRCNCWAPPTDLFLVCRVLCRDAQLVFFSGNRFVVHDFHAMAPWALPAVQLEDPGTAITGSHYPYGRFAASEFLRDIVPTHRLASLRFLELVFPPYVPYGWPNHEHPAVPDWYNTVYWVRPKLNAPALTLRVVMADFYGHVQGRQNLTQDQGRSIMIGRFVRDDGLAGFYAQLAYPGRWTQATRLRMQRCGTSWLATTEQRLKESWERKVRRRDASLDSQTKAEPRKSVWQRWYDVDFC